MRRLVGLFIGVVLLLTILAAWAAGARGAPSDASPPGRRPASVGALQSALDVATPTATPTATSGDLRWTIQTFDQADGAHTSLKLDAAGRPHISYIGGPDGALQYAHWTGTAWVTQTISEAGSRIRGTSLALDSAGNPHIAYFSEGSAVYYARWTGSVWDIQPVGGSGGAYGVALALDATDTPHVVYGWGDVLHDGLRYVHKMGGTWLTQDVGEMAGSEVAIALDASGRPHIAYGNGYAWWTGQTWATVLLPDAGFTPSLALDASDRPHLGYYSRGKGIQYLSWTGSDWAIETVDSNMPEYTSEYTSLALDAAGQPHVSYAGMGGLRYAWRVGAQWHSEVVDQDGSLPSLALDAANQPHIGYYGASRHDLRYAVGRLSVPPLPTPTSMATPTATITPTPTPSGPGWSLKTVAAPPFSDQVRDRSLRLDADGHAHIAYGGDRLYYAWHDGRVWHTEVVDDAPGVGRGAVLALDTSDHAHIVYRDAVHDTLMYAVWTGARWLRETVDQGGEHASLALDAADQPHISYRGRGVKYASRVGTQWHIQSIDGGGSDTSLALDVDGRPRIAYMTMGREPGPSQPIHSLLRYAQWTETEPGMPGYWQVTTVDSNCEGDGYFAAHVSLALDGTGAPHIAYDTIWVYHTCGTSYAYFSAGAWQRESVNWSGENPLSLALDAASSPYIVSGLGYTYKVGSAWETQTIVPNISNVSSASLALDAAGQPHISYVDGVGLRMAHGTQASPGGGAAEWRIETVAQSGVDSTHSALKVDAAGQTHLSYTNAEGLQYARRVGAEWQSEIMDPAGSLPSLVLDAASQPHLSYVGAGGLTYARRVGGQWQSEIVDPAGSAPSLALDAAGQPHISYCVAHCTDTSCVSAVCYAQWTGSEWIAETLTNYSSGGGYDPSLALDTHGHPHIAFYHAYGWGPGEGGVLEYTYWTGLAWQTQMVDQQDESGGTWYRVGQNPSLALDAADRPHIGYCDQYCGYSETFYCYNGDLRYARWTGVAWSIETVDSAGDEGNWWGLEAPDWGGLALGASGSAHVSYHGWYDYYGGANRYGLRYARRDAGAWTLETVDGEGDTGQYSALALDGAGSPHISYYDPTSHRLRYAQRAAPAPTPTPSASATPTATPTLTVTPMPTATPSPTDTPTPRRWEQWLPLVWRGL